MRTDLNTPTEPLTGGAGYRFGIVFSRFNHVITERLRDGALRALTEAGTDPTDVETYSVPGAFELPQAARRLGETGRFDAIICLGCVIRGATAHFEYISASAANGIQDASADTGVPMAFGVLTPDTWEQAEERASGGRDNKGFEAAAAALEMAQLFRRLLPSGSLQP